MADRYIPEHRRTNFKAKSSFKPDELRRRREEQQVEIRKQKREEGLAKRRGITGRGEAALGASLGAAPDSDDESGTIESQVCAALYMPLLPCILHSRGHFSDAKNNPSLVYLQLTESHHVPENLSHA